jgi:tyrosyl-tRNA synthetase
LDVACAGIDQRKAHALARDVGEKLGWGKPTSLHTPLLIGLAGAKRMETGKFDENRTVSSQISFKMSKSVAGSGIIVHDDPATIKDKLKRAYCPEKEVDNNPVLQIVRYLLFPWKGLVTIERPQKYGGPTDYATYDLLQTEYRQGKIHPLDLKNAVGESLIEILEPVRKEFTQHPEQLRKMEELEVTR